MKGTILHVDHQTGEGVISAADGRRYRVREADLLGDGRIVRAGQPVDFEVEDGRAVRVYPDPAPSAAAVATALLGHKNRIVAGLLAFFVGSFGIHKFYLGYNGAGIIMLICSLLGWVLLWIPTAIVALIALIEAVIYFTRSDAQFHDTYEVGRRPWF